MPKKQLPYSILTVPVLAVLLLSVAAKPLWAADTAAGVESLRSQLIGFYQGTAPDQTKPGATVAVYHKIVEVVAPQLGGSVIYHQISRDGFDAAQPLLQKFYVLPAPTTSGKTLTVSVYSVKPGSLPGNLELQPRELATLSPTALQSFPASCALSWRQSADGSSWVATPTSPRCRYLSATLKKTIVPEFRYELTKEALATRDVLRDTRGKPLFGDAGILQARRVAANTAAMVIATSRLAEWRSLDPARVLQMELQSGAKLWIELAPDLAPLAVANILTLTREKYFDGLSVNRVQDNFVAQWGDPESTRLLGSARRRLPAEFSRDWPATLTMTALPDTDGFAPQTGFVVGMPVGADNATRRIWGAHCYGSVGVGRDVDETTGNGTELYAVIGHAPRQLDRNVTVVGRVVRGIDNLSSLPRGTGALGFYESASARHGIKTVRVLADVPAAERLNLQALRTDSGSFTALVEARRNRRDEWYKVSAGHIDVCSVPLPVREMP